MIHTCPRCELRFASDTELTDHLKIDHHADPEEFDSAALQAEAGSGPVGKRYLLLANRTLEESWLLPRLLEFAESGAHFHVVVSPTPTESGGDRTDDKGLGLASYRLRYIVDKLHEAGIEAEGEVGNADPLRAVTRAIEHQPADEILVATLPRGVSRWLEVDLPATLHRRFSVPVTTLTRSLTATALRPSPVVAPAPSSPGRCLARQQGRRPIGTGRAAARWSMIACAERRPDARERLQIGGIRAIEIDRPAPARCR